MLQALVNIFRIPELRNKVLFTLGMLVVYRIGFWIPIPGIDQAQLAETMRRQVDESTGAGKAIEFMAIFSGGSFSHSTIFGLGIMPYITAGIIFQILATALPALKKLQQEGPTGRQKIAEWTRYATIVLCLFQAATWLAILRGQQLIFPGWRENPVWWIMAITAMTAGTMFLMWLGEQIDKHGIGNGISLIITAGILAQMPMALLWVIKNSPIGQIAWIGHLFNVPRLTDDPTLPWMGVIFLIGAFLFVVAGAVLITVAQRRIPVQQAKHTRGRKVFGGEKSYLPLRINHGGVMPIVFASSLMFFPSVIAGQFQQLSANSDGWVRTLSIFLNNSFQIGAFPYEVLYIGMIYFFSYFWTTIQFNPEEMAKQLRDHGSFIPGLRPGPRTAEYLETVMERITYVGAGFLSVIAVIPTLIMKGLGVPYNVAAFLGGTGLLIVVSVGLDFIQRVEANLLMRNYAGFLGGNDRGKGPRMRGPRG